MAEGPDGVASQRRQTRRRVLLAALIAVIAAFAGFALLVNIFERKQEARNPFFRVVELTDATEDPAVWGKNFPLQYDGYKRTSDQVRTRYGGSEALPRTPTQADPRSVIAQSKIEEDPRLKIMWAGYAFARDFREERGHAYMLEDQMFTERQVAAVQPGACLLPLVRRNGQIETEPAAEAAQDGVAAQLRHTLRELFIAAHAAGRDPRRVAKLNNVVLAAADLDLEVVDQRLGAERVGLGVEW